MSKNIRGEDNASSSTSARSELLEYMLIILYAHIIFHFADSVGGGGEDGGAGEDRVGGELEGN